MATAVVAPQPAHAMQPFTRPIRFVANDGQPHAKRRRISAACKTCRKRKTRCSGEKPICETCRQNGHSCLGYSDPTNSTPVSSAHQTQRQQSRARSESTPTVVTTPTDKPLKEPLFSPTPSPHDRPRRPSVQQPLPSEQHELRGTESRAKSQKRKSTDYHDAAGRGNEHDMDSSGRVDGGSGGELTDEGPSPVLRYRSPPSQRLAHRMPYFRYFGPTAIVPGYKQMVVEVHDRDNIPRHSSLSMSANSSVTSPASTFGSLGNPNSTPTVSSGTNNVPMEDIPFYDPNDPAPNSPLIAHLVETFFSHLGCNFPFLRKEVFTKDVEEKRVEGILVDAVCAVAARFSNNSLLQSLVRNGEKVPSSEYGTAFAIRAKNRVVDTFACPNLASVQACILLAYVEFGSNRDSGLWMFLGMAIRMAQDLGLQKLEGTRGDAEEGSEARRSMGRYGDRVAENHEDYIGDENAREAKARERERTDTFWAVFFLDRVISSGTGRPVAIRDKEIEIDFPPIEEVDPEHGYPPPFPALIRIIQLYGRITDLLNSIKDVHTVTPDTLRRLSDMEADLTKIYQRLSPKLHFGVANFQHYASTNQGAVFLLLHFWFHTLIVLLHRPTLLIAFEGSIQQLFSNSRELSMSSAKTIADILAFAELLDSKAVNGNPFTSQPIYIAACAFLQESAAHSSSNPTSRSSSPPPSGSLPGMILGFGSKIMEEGTLVQKLSTKHALLAQAAHQNYQKCYKALKAMETYWEGVKYILTVMDQKAKGIVDPLLYTVEEMESVEVHRWGAGMWNRFRGNLTPGAEQVNGAVHENIIKLEGGLLQSSLMPPGGQLGLGTNRMPERVPSPLMSGIHGDPNQAIGWSVTGTTNSPNSNLTFMFPASSEAGVYTIQHPQYNGNASSPHAQHHCGIQQAQDPRNGLMTSGMHPPLPHGFVGATPASTASLAASPQSKYSMEASTPAASDAEMLLGLSVEQQRQQQKAAGIHHSPMDGLIMGGGGIYNSDEAGNAVGAYNAYNIMIESEDINMNSMGVHQLLPYLEFVPYNSYAYGPEAGDGLVDDHQHQHQHHHHHR
ncbi:hypothetical protein L873DRAFT_1674713 [Choiromyces venosus 120613-1]|uniref:Zn(2)-C6 fungal-type domain-containing protein n=1 Tax=Choiromyces venosus 120613-1 TaxID=1336337 RepID=A0A3N4JYF9_9PEZI|nr:hypothetical protein L873DRAFT_1674713 [Choiromyces venosus 120613-1]